MRTRSLKTESNYLTSMAIYNRKFARERVKKESIIDHKFWYKAKTSKQSRDALAEWRLSLPWKQSRFTLANSRFVPVTHFPSFFFSFFSFFRLLERKQLTEWSLLFQKMYAWSQYLTKCWHVCHLGRLRLCAEIKSSWNVSCRYESFEISI